MNAKLYYRKKRKIEKSKFLFNKFNIIKKKLKKVKKKLKKHNFLYNYLKLKKKKILLNFYSFNKLFKFLYNKLFYNKKKNKYKKQNKNNINIKKILYIKNFFFKKKKKFIKRHLYINTKTFYILIKNLLKYIIKIKKKFIKFFKIFILKLFYYNFLIFNIKIIITYIKNLIYNYFLLINDFSIIQKNFHITNKYIFKSKNYNQKNILNLNILYLTIIKYLKKTFFLLFKTKKNNIFINFFNIFGKTLLKCTAGLKKIFTLKNNKNYLKRNFKTLTNLITVNYKEFNNLNKKLRLKFLIFKIDSRILKVYKNINILLNLKKSNYIKNIQIQKTKNIPFGNLRKKNLKKKDVLI